MNTSSFTSTAGTQMYGSIRDTGSGPKETSAPSPSPTDISGPPCMEDSTEEESGTNTSRECDFAFVVQFGNRHPIGITCLVHGWYADVRDA